MILPAQDHYRSEDSMADFAQLDEKNTVINVVVVSDDTVYNLPFPQSEPIGISFLKTVCGEDTNWAQTSFDGSFRYRYAGIGYFFDQSVQAFVAPKPFPSWLLAADDYSWHPPVPYPDDGKPYFWNEATLSWVLADPPQ